MCLYKCEPWSNDQPSPSQRPGHSLTQGPSLLPQRHRETDIREIRAGCGGRFAPTSQLPSPSLQMHNLSPTPTKSVGVSRRPKSAFIPQSPNPRPEASRPGVVQKAHLPNCLLNTMR